MSEQTLSIGPGEGIDLESVGGDLHVEGWERQELQARGDVLRVDRQANGVAVSCAGNLVLSVPQAAPILVRSIGGNVELQNLAGSIDLDLVVGDATLRNLTGLVRLRGMVGGEVHLENVTNVSMNSGGVGEHFPDADRIRRKAEQAARRAAVKVRKAERRGFRFSQMWGPQADVASRGQNTAEPPADAPTDEERMMILRMLQDRKITSEQADKLLAALEGNS